ncbi:MAG: hypothetical protein HRT89_02515 [Lentisphaeria bacterium]|nr:hypothetical protein [Lentisphaeria bacterium]NQZ66922.1 hypothetical protein [Lentisphaeria bacterium]
MSEVELFDKKTQIKFSGVSASHRYNDGLTYIESKVIDREKVGVVMAWILPDKTKGWIELSIN